MLSATRLLPVYAVFCFFIIICPSLCAPPPPPYATRSPSCGLDASSSHACSGMRIDAGGGARGGRIPCTILHTPTQMCRLTRRRRLPSALLPPTGACLSCRLCDAVTLSVDASQTHARNVNHAHHSPEPRRKHENWVTKRWRTMHVVFWPSLSPPVQPYSSCYLGVWHQLPPRFFVRGWVGNAWGAGCAMPPRARRARLHDKQRGGWRGRRCALSHGPALRSCKVTRRASQTPPRQYRPLPSR